MAETNLNFSKVVATPTPGAWSQAYSAGRLFAAFSLETDIIPEAGGEHLNSIGKDLISTLESEFFTLEKKDLQSIKQAITTTVGKIREDIKLSMILCYLSENVLYLFATGGGKAVLKSGDKIGTVLEADETQTIKSASGYVQEEDIIILETKSFQKVIPQSILASSLDHNNPEDIAESLAPHLHEKPEGAASSIILLYKKAGLEEMTPPSEEPETEIEDEALEEKEQITSSDQTLAKTPPEDIDQVSEPVQEPQPETFPIDEVEEAMEPTSPFLSDQLPRRRRVSFGFGLGLVKRLPYPLSHRRRVALTIAGVLIVLIAASAFLALTGRQSQADKELFESVITSAQEKYDEGQNLKDLNAPLAQESFREAKKILDENKDRFRQGSTEDKQIEDLLAQVNKEVSASTDGQIVSAKEVEKSESKLLLVEIDNPKATYFAQNEDFIYFVDSSGVSRIDKGNNEKEQIIKKDWKEEGGIGLFGSNVYVLDRRDGILKFVGASESAYNKTDYFSEAPDLGSSIAMAIDGSVYILLDDGSIKKYTRGKEDSFSVSGVEKAMSKPSRIATNEDSDNIYILDNGNSRVIVLDKDGKFVSAYSAGVIKNAKDLDVDETGKKIFILSGGKVYQIDLK
ncbi:MAG: hypothetical protein HYW63_02095 [Candidatus Levybacteria bacterium]|nr:hypothetical protein [Candidatus Levybacteria bacterium]